MNRKVSRYPKFSSELKKLSRRHHGLEDTIDNKIANLPLARKRIWETKYPSCKVGLYSRNG